MFPTPGMCAERFHFFSCEVAADAEMQPPEGDGSVFEQGAQLEWVALDEALRRCGRGEIQDVKTELGLRRLREQL
jgi:ADP-ribose pyrophosphatase